MLLAACASAPAPGPGVPDLVAAEVDVDANGRCWGRDVAPAVIETLTAQEIERPAEIAPDGRVIAPAVYRTVTRQQIVRERDEVAFETICPPVYSREFVESLQRALAVRGYYRGPVNGILDTAIGRAVQDFQRDGGPDSPLLSIAAARALGLVALSPEELDSI